jgi:WD40 repeat protein
VKKPDSTDRALVNTIAARTLKLELYDINIVRDYIPLLGKLPNDPQELDIEAEVLSKFLAADRSNNVVLLMGDAGSGKTSFGLNLFNTLISKYKEGGPIPLWIPLISVTDLKNIIKCHCRDQLKLDEADINDLEKRSLILILDGYEEAGTERNLYRDNNFDDLSVQVVFTCRRETAFRIREQYHVLFQPDTSRGRGLIEYHVLPFNARLVKAFAERYCQHHETRWNFGNYLDEFRKLPELEELITNPFVLAIVMSELPGIIAELNQFHAEKTNVERIKITRNKIFKCYTEKLFVRQKEKLLRGVMPPGFELRYPGVTIEVLMAEFSRKLALALFQHKVCSIKRPPLKTIVSQRSWVLDVFSSSRIKQAVDKYSWESRFFDDDNDPYLSHIRSGCPLKLIAENQYAFRHSSLLYFFASEQLFNGVVIDAWALSGENLNAEIIEDTEALRFLVEKVEGNKEFEKTLFSIVMASSHECSIVIAAINAITILNQAQISFCGRNFEGIRIGGVYKKTLKNTGLIEWGYDLDGRLWEGCNSNNGEPDYQFYGANLRNAVCDGASFDRADLRCACFSHATLDNASFENACLDGAEFGELPSLKGTLCCYSADGKWLALVENRINRLVDDFLIIIYDTTSYQVKFQIESKKEVQLIAIDPRSEYIASAGADNIICLWDIKLGKKVNECIGHTKPIYSIAFSPSKKQLASCGPDGAIYLWDIALDHPRPEIFAKYELNFHHLLYGIGGGQLIGMNERNNIHMWDENGMHHHEFKFDEPGFENPEIKTGDRQAAAIKNFTRVAQASRASSSRIETLNGFPSCMQMNPAVDYQLAVGSINDLVQLLDLRISTITQTFRGHDAPISVLCYRQDGVQLASGSQDGTVKVWDVITGECLHTFKGDGSKVAALSFCLSFDNKYILASSYAAGAVRLWITNTSRFGGVVRSENQRIDCVPGAVAPISFSSAGQIAIGDKGGQVWIFDRNTGKCSALLPTDVWLLESFNLGVFNLQHSPSGKQLAIGTSRGVITLWDLTTNNITYKLEGHASEVSCMAYNLLGSRLVSGSYDGIINLWDAITGNKLWHLKTSGMVVFSGFLASENQIAYTLLARAPEEGEAPICTLNSFDLEAGEQDRSVEWGGIVSFARFYRHNQLPTMMSILFNKVDLWDINSSVHTPLLTQHSARITVADYCLATNQLVTTSSHDKEPHFHLYRLDNKKLVLKVKSQYQFVDLRWSCDGKVLATADTRGAFKLWQVEESDNGVLFRLIWTSLHEFTTDNLKLSSLTGLDEIGLSLFKQRGSVTGEPMRSRRTEAIATSQLTLEGRNRQVFIPTGVINLPPSENNGGFIINKDLWVISLVRHKTERPDHTYMVIQGVDQHNFTVIEERHFVINSFKRTYLWGMAGAGLIRRASKSPWDLADEAQNFLCSPFSITRAQVALLFNNIDEQEAADLNYLISGRSPGLFGQKSYNCISWCLEHMERVGISVSATQPESVKFYDFIAVIPSNYLPDNRQSKSSCTIG